MRSRALVYFGGVLTTIALTNTPVPKIVASAVLNPEAGDAVARSLSSITKDLVLVLLVSIYFEWARSRNLGELLRSVDLKIDEMREEARTMTAPATRRLVLDASSPEELVTAALDRHIPHQVDKSSLVSMVLGAHSSHHDVSVTLRVESVKDSVLQVSSRYEVTMPRGQVLVAATFSPSHAATFGSAIAELFEIVTLPGSTPVEEAVRTFGERLECYVEPVHGAVRKAPSGRCRPARCASTSRCR